jgi:hypothetical protein
MGTSPEITVDTRDLPKIVVELSPGAELADGGATPQTFACPVGYSVSRTFTIRNIGAANLTGLTVSVDGEDDDAFSVPANPVAPVSAPSGSTTFTVQFTPTSEGPKTAALHIANNDPDRAPFDIPLSGKVLTLAEDADNDGLSDASEFQMAAFGFDWEVTQTERVDTYFAAANGAGLYTLPQIQALHSGTPLLTRDAQTGRFKLTIAVKKAASLDQPFTAFPMNEPGTTTVINEQGNLEFEFPAPGDAAFFRIEEF